MSNGEITVFHNRTSVKNVLFRINLPICGYRGSLWPTLPVNIIILFSLQSLQRLLAEKLFNDEGEVLHDFAMPILEQCWKGISESNSSSIIGFAIYIKLAFVLGFFCLMLSFAS